MNEHSFTLAVTGKLPSDVHVQSMTMAAVTHNGTPDRYIDYKRDLWVEFKYAKTKGTNGFNMAEMLSPQQKVWLRRRYEAGRNAIVIVGVPDPKTKAMGFVLNHPDLWEAIKLRVHEPLLTARELSDYILMRVT